MNFTTIMATRRSLHSREYGILTEMLRVAREDAGLTQVELAKRLKRPQTFVSKCELGERRVDLIEIREICVALKRDFGDFVQGLDATLRASRK